MITIHSKYTGELRTEAEHLGSGNTLITDAPLDNNGKGEAFSPTDLLATAYGSCMLTIMGIAARTHGFNIDGTSIDITKIMENNPRRVGKLVVHLHFPEIEYSSKEKKIIERIAHTCPVAMSLHPDLVKEVYFHFYNETNNNN